MKKIILSILAVGMMSFTQTPECYRAQCEGYVYNYGVDRIISDIEDYMEWTNEDLYQGVINEKTHARRIEYFQGTLDDLLQLERTLIHLK